MAQYKNKVIVVTGASGGIGMAICNRMQAEGMRVFALDLYPPKENIGIFIKVDVTDELDIARGVNQIIIEVGHIDYLVAAAGVAEASTPCEEMTAQVWDHTMNINLRGVFLTCQAVGKSMLKVGSGRIVAIASMSGNSVVNSPQKQIAYNASKAGVTAMTKSMAYEWGPRGIRINALSPGYVGTTLLESKKEMHNQWKSATPLGRFATPEEVAAATLFLLSDDADFFLGSELLMDGGYGLA
jgi:NAD(P)-dependent dehydrogenase (short-subunit alcohol dehydrogenase family)